MNEQAGRALARAIARQRKIIEEIRTLEGELSREDDMIRQLRMVTGEGEDDGRGPAGDRER